MYPCVCEMPRERQGTCLCTGTQFSVKACIKMGLSDMPGYYKKIVEDIVEEMAEIIWKRQGCHRLFRGGTPKESGYGMMMTTEMKSTRAIMMMMTIVIKNIYFCNYKKKCVYDFRICPALWNRLPGSN